MHEEGCLITSAHITVAPLWLIIPLMWVVVFIIMIPSNICVRRTIVWKWRVSGLLQSKVDNWSIIIVNLINLQHCWLHHWYNHHQVWQEEAHIGWNQRVSHWFAKMVYSIESCITVSHYCWQDFSCSEQYIMSSECNLAGMCWVALYSWLEQKST